MLLLALLGAASLGGWFVVAPALAPRGATGAEPAEDLDAPVTNALVASAPGRARPPGARKDAAAATASGVSTLADPLVDPRCGDDQVPVSEEPRPDPADGTVHVPLPVADPDGVVRRQAGEIKPAGVGYTGAMARIDASLRASADPFDRAMADWLDLDLITPPAARLNALVNDALAVSDPRVYALAWTACHGTMMSREAKDATPRSCASLTVGDWARRDPGNGVPWLNALAQAQAAGDVGAQQEALRQLTAADRFDVHAMAGAAAVARVKPSSDADLAAQLVATGQAIPVPFMVPPFHSLTVRCRDKAGGDVALAATCARIADTLFHHSDSLTGRAIGGLVHRLATGDSSWADQALAERKQYAASAESQMHEPLTGPAPPTASSCGRSWSSARSAT